MGFRSYENAREHGISTLVFWRLFTALNLYKAKLAVPVWRLFIALDLYQVKPYSSVYELKPNPPPAPFSISRI